MEIESELKAISKRIRPHPSRQLVFWSWLFNLTTYAILGWAALNRHRLAVRFRLAPESSLFSNMWLMVGAIIAILLLMAAIHEVGHLIGGWLMNLRFQLLVVGPLKVAREGNSLHVGLSRGAALFSGLAASIPLDNFNLRRRMLGFALGGPVANVIVAIAAVALFLALRDNRSVMLAHAWLLECTVLVAVVSFVFFLTSMKPGLYPNGLPADGARIFTLLRGGATADRWCALVALNGADLRGQRPRQWDEKLLEQALSVPDGSYDDLNAHMLGYQWALDSGRIEQAAEFLDEALASRSAWISGTRARLALEKAYFMGRHRGDPVEARQWLQQVRQSHIAVPLQCRAEAATLLAEGKYEAAGKAAQRGLTDVGRLAPPGSSQAEAEWLEEIIRLAQNK